MSNHIPNEIASHLQQLLDIDISASVCTDLNEALEVAEYLESQEFSFKLKDMAPKNLHTDSWRAVFIHNGKEYNAEDSQAALAICLAATAALEGLLS